MLKRGIPAVLLVLVFALPAQAHKVILNAWGEGDTLVTEIGFSDGSAGHGAKVTISDADTGKEVLTGTADESGVFEAKLPAEVISRGHDFRVHGNAGSGHQAETVVMADEFAPAETPPSSAATQSTPGNAPDPAAFKALVREAVREEIKPLRREIKGLSDTGPKLSSILGGIGYLFGLAGVAAIVGARRRTHTGQ